MVSINSLRVSKEGSRCGDRAALVKEIQEAFQMGRGENFLGYSSKPDLVWLHLQCSGEGPYLLYQGDRSKLNIFDKQTCRRWKAMMEMERVKHPLRQRRRVVVIQPITHQNDLPLKRHGEGGLGVEPEEMGYRHTHISANVLELLRNFCAAYFSEMQVELAPPIDLSEITKLTSRVHKTTNRRQFLVDDIIHFLSTKKLRKAYCILGVTVVDLYPGAEWNFVLGQACMERGSGVFSFGRYFNNSMSTSSCERSGCGVKGESPPPGADSDGRETVEDEWEQQQIRNLWVLMRVMSHELCHLFGLAHCHYFQCAMNESSSISEAAIQPLFLCPLCLRKLNKVQRSLDIAQRYSGLLEAIKTLRRAMLKVIQTKAALDTSKGTTESSSTLDEAATRRDTHRPLSQCEGTEKCGKSVKSDGGGGGGDCNGQDDDKGREGGNRLGIGDDRGAGRVGVSGDNEGDKGGEGDDRVSVGGDRGSEGDDRVGESDDRIGVGDDRGSEGDNRVSVGDDTNRGGESGNTVGVGDGIGDDRGSEGENRVGVGDKVSGEEHIDTNGQLDKMNAAILWLEDVIQRIRDFKNTTMVATAAGDDNRLTNNDVEH